MDRATDERWREALEKKGQDAIRHKLDLRPGPPGELFYDIVDAPPYPDRAFCEAWCRGVPPRTGGMSRIGAMVVIMSILVVVCGLRAFTSSSKQDANWLSPTTSQYHPSAAAAAPHGGGAGSSDDSIQNSAAQNSSVINTQQKASILPSCSSVSSAGTVATVHSAGACSKLGQPFKQGSGSGS
jgi:hypothetical protein